MKAKEIIGNFYKTKDGVEFQVLDAEFYSQRTVSFRYKRILDFKPGLLVAVAYRGALIPNITMDGGVARLTKVEVNGETFDRPHAISTAIGVKDDMSSYFIKDIKSVAK